MQAQKSVKNYITERISNLQILLNYANQSFFFSCVNSNGYIINGSYLINGSHLLPVSQLKYSKVYVNMCIYDHIIKHNILFQNLTIRRIYAEI